MPAIISITVRIHTADVRGAETVGAVYLGLAGREFRLRKSAAGLARGAEDTFTLGEEADVFDAEFNDPRSPGLDTADLDRFPAYLRLAPAGPGSAWCLEDVTVTVNPGSGSPVVLGNPALEGDGPERRIWLDDYYGTTLHLRRAAPDDGDDDGGGTGRMMVRGTIRADASIAGGSGNFTVSKRGAGRYVIEFGVPFPGVPSGAVSIWGSNWWMADDAHLATVGTARAEIFTSASDGSLADRDFSFVIVG
ncbi:hypothetical protein [Streptomyces aidingensis]|uniref:Uncharacterized protein n=1 Tax=Streptomyces aidingensis TaxID=910347 RepID=A0A1I1S3S5_9ACTN|nr:hypothetical protein [Streptomyces aidingensis]SFD41002.1 hypothetical protein SAMN05421773_114163 [Streptomyces aidingensis]